MRSLLIGPFGEAQKNIYQLSRNISRTVYLDSIVEEYQKIEKILESPDSSTSDILVAKAVLEQLDKQLEKLLKLPSIKEQENDSKYEKEI